MRISAWIILIISSSFLVKETFSTPIPYEVTLVVHKRGYDKKFPLVVNECVWLKQRRIDGDLVSIEHGDNCVEVHENEQCDGDFVVAKPGVPATEQLFRWNLNGSRPWIDIFEGAKAVRPCRDKCDPANFLFPKRGDQVVHVSLYSDIGFEGMTENVTIKGCQVIPKSLRNNVASLLTDGSYCIELHGTRNCAGAFIEIPRKVPWHFTRNLENYWLESYSSRKTVAVSLCGYNCPDSVLKVDTTPPEPEQLPQGQVAMTLYTEPHFQGEKVKVDLTGVECYKVPISSPLRVVTYESVDTHEKCFHLFEKDGKCNREKGNFITVSNWEEGSDLVLRGLTGGIKSIAPCPPNSLFPLLLSLFLVAILVLAILIVAIYLKRKRDKSPNFIPKPKDNLNAPGSNQCTEPLIPQSHRSRTIGNIPWDLTNPVEIGQGAFGVVYRATADKELGRPDYAVKKICVNSFKLYYYRHNEGCVNGWISKILCEVEALKNLSNDHVVKYYRCQFEGEHADVYNNGDISQVLSEPDFTSGQADKRLTFFYIQMEYCNSDLRKWLTKSKSLETRIIAEIQEIFCQSLTALQYIHEKQITHRDLKPENIFTVATKASMRIKIGDFGLATCNLNDLNDKGDVGTKIYRSPEMNSTFDTRDFKTDIYSLGLVFLECINPELNDKWIRKFVFDQILLGNYTFPKFIQTGFSNEIKLIRNMTKTNKEERFGAKQALQYLKENVIRSLNRDLCTSSNMQVSF